MLLVKHYLLLLLAISLFFGPCSSRSLRQKRGIMKMMMHIMWDPVRLIRYWYAYDVTKEIAKSWRKIIPTMMLLPLSSNPSGTPGIAKYVHPTYGLKESSHHKPLKQFSYPSLQSGEVYHVQDGASMEHSDGVYAGMEMKHGTPMKQASNINPFTHQHFIRADDQNEDNFSHFPITSESKHTRNIPQVVWKPVQYEKDGNSRESIRNSDVRYMQEHIHHSQIAIPYEVHPIQNNDRLSFKSVPMSGSNVVFPSSFSLPGSQTHHGAEVMNKNTNQFDQIPYQIVVHQPDYETNSRNETDEVRTDHQEIHIVLHPIPVSESNMPDYQKHAGSNHFPFKISQSSSEHFVNMLQRVPLALFHGSQGSNNSESGVTESDAERNIGNKNFTENSGDNSVEFERTPSVIWTLQQNNNDTGIFNSSNADQDVEESVTRLKSLDVSKSGVERKPLYPPTVNTYGINILQLKEDLKHGTPVFIPFNNPKNIPIKTVNQQRHKFFVGRPTDIIQSASSKNKITFPSSSSDEPIGKNNSMQKLVLFMANKKPVQ